MLIAVAMSYSCACVIAHAEYFPEYEKCMNNSDGTTTQMVSCISQELERQDAMLNAYYKNLMNNLDEEHFKVIKKAQKAWIRYRDANVEVAGYDGGSFASINMNSVMLEMTKNRVEELKALSDTYL